MAKRDYAAEKKANHDAQYGYLNLLPCPFCGVAPRVTKRSSRVTGGNEFDVSIRCPNCGCKTEIERYNCYTSFRERLQRVANIWNHRV